MRFLIMNILDRSFYTRDTVLVARELIGKKIVRIIDGIELSGIICETEAYCSDADPASHAFKGKTQRTAPMFETVGCAYIYFIYGNHYCFDVVARDESVAAGGILVRAAVPVSGIEIMKKHRGVADAAQVANGPGKLAQAFAITKEHNFVDLTQEGELFIADGIQVKDSDIVATPRIGISKAQDKLWRFVYNKLQ